MSESTPILMHETSDSQLLDLLRVSGPLTIAEIAHSTVVTATAVRQRLTRLMAQGLVDREAQKVERGRPSHCYSLSEKARRRAGSNFADLALVLWQEIRTISDPEVRRGLLQRVSDALVGAYKDQVTGDDVTERMNSVKSLFALRDVPLAVGSVGGLPVLTALECPYPALAEQDRGICAVEKMLFSELLDESVRLTHCRLDGHSCCQFQTS